MYIGVDWSRPPHPEPEHVAHRSADCHPRESAVPIVSEEVSFVAGGRTIPGTLVHPASGTGPGLLLLAGSGPTDRDWNSPLLPGKNGSGRLLAEALAARGVTVLRFDKAFSGANHGLPIAELTLDTYRDEATAALDFPPRPSRGRSRAVFVAGHSEGGIHATRLAQSAGDRFVA
jgi:pimeloyl-ACP methyl ester carboxylesterase